MNKEYAPSMEGTRSHPWRENQSRSMWIIYLIEESAHHTWSHQLLVLWTTSPWYFLYFQWQNGSDTMLATFVGRAHSPFVVGSTLRFLFLPVSRSLISYPGDTGISQLHNTAETARPSESGFGSSRRVHGEKRSHFTMNYHRSASQSEN